MPTQLVIPRRALFALLILVLAGTGALFAYARLPKAVITVYPAAHERSVTQDITLSAAAQEPDFVRFVLPAKLLEDTVTASQTFKREAGNAAEDFARGTVTLHNEQDEEQALLPRTNLRHEATGVFFLTDAAVTIPPKNKVSVGITAKEKGAKGNVAAGKFIVDKLPASLQAVVFAESSVPLSGGLSASTPLTETELKTARDEVYAKARDQARQLLSTKAGGAGVRTDLLTLETETENIGAQVGSKPTEFTVSYTLKARAFVTDENDVLSLTLLALRSSPTADEAFLSYIPESFKLEIVRTDFTRGEARVKGALTGRFAQKTEPTLFAATNLAGRTRPEVEEYFKQFPSVGKVDVTFSPFWVKAVPARAEAIEIVIKNEP